MTKANTFFEQVPVALARQITARQSGIEQSSPVLCGICGTPVELEHCKTNEFGQAVHGKCYASQIGARDTKPVPLSFRDSRKAVNR